MYKTIAVYLDASQACAKRISAAVAIARLFDSVVTGVFPKSGFVPYAGIGARTFIPSINAERFLQERARETGKASADARAAFESAMLSSGLNWNWLELSGDRAGPFVACARRHDLSILPPAMTPVFGDRITTAAEVGLQSGRPVLVLADQEFSEGAPQRILVAWSDTREAARALSDVWPLLQQARDIHVLSVRSQSSDLDDAFLHQAFIAHNCPSAKFHIEQAGEGETGTSIRRWATHLDIDMLVAGLYGHSRVREIVLGGVSRSLLRDVPAPLFLSH